MKQRSVGQIFSNDETRIATIFSDDETRIATIFYYDRRKAAPFEIAMSDCGNIKTEYAWTVFDAVELAEMFVIG